MGLSFEKTKDAAGHPTALGGRSLREDQVICNMYIRLGQATNQLCLGSIEPVPAEPLEEVLFKCFSRSQKPFLSQSDLVPFVANCCQLDSADVVGYLEKTVLAWLNIAVNNCILKECGTHCSVYGFTDDALAVVVVNLYDVESLKELQVVIDKSLDVSLHLVLQGRWLGKLLLFVFEARVVEGELLDEEAETTEQSLSGGVCNRVEGGVPAQDWCEMKDAFRQVACRAGLFVLGKPSVNAIGLIVENKREKIVLGASTDVARLIDKYRKLTHWPASWIKKPGETPRRLRQAFQVESLNLLIPHLDCFIRRDSERKAA